MRSHSASAVNRVLRNSPEDPCIPSMLASLPPSVLARVNRRLIDQLPGYQRSAISRSVYARVGQPTQSSAQNSSLGQDRQY